MQKLNHESKINLKNGVYLPVIGLGTYKLKEGGEVENAVRYALDCGYRLIDTASVYQNEAGIAKGIEGYGLLREEVFLTTKVWNADQGYESTLRALEDSLARLGVAYVDLYLVHWPTTETNLNESGLMINKREETWRAMEVIYKSGKARAIGVSNFTIEHLKEMEKYANIMPMVNQIEFNPFLYQKDLLEYCRLHDIALQASCPVVRNQKVDNPVLVSIAQKHARTVAQILLRWGLQKGISLLPRSSKEAHIKENIAIFNFELDLEDMDALDNLNENLHLYKNPADLN